MIHFLQKTDVRNYLGTYSDSSSVIIFCLSSRQILNLPFSLFSYRVPNRRVITRYTVCIIHRNLILCEFKQGVPKTCLTMIPGTCRRTSSVAWHTRFSYTTGRAGSELPSGDSAFPRTAS
jgi:hypothetical protein